MSVPERTSQHGTFFVTAVCADRRRIFQRYPNAQLLFVHLQEHRRKEYLLHAFVIMPDHLHLLITPNETLERAMQIVKGGFSRKYGLLTTRKVSIWQRGFTDHRIRNREEFLTRKSYLEANPVMAGLSARPEQYRWFSAYTPSAAEAEQLNTDYGTAEAVPFRP